MLATIARPDCNNNLHHNNCGGRGCCGCHWCGRSNGYEYGHRTTYAGGGGDVKLMGALSVWLGFSLTWKVLLVSSLLAIAGTFFVIVYSSLTRGVMNTKDKYTATGKTPKGQKPQKETMEQRTRRRAMGFAVPVALATWAVVAYYLPSFPWLDQPVAAVATVAPAE